MTHSGHGGYHGPTQQHFVQGQSAQIPGQLGYGPSPVAPPEYTNVALLPGEQTLFAGDFAGRVEELKDVRAIDLSLRHVEN